MYSRLATAPLAAVYAWMARAESAHRSERVRAGLERRRREGKPVGRQPGATDKRPRKRSGYVARWERERDAAVGAVNGPRERSGPASS
jgi:DNA invertase Pin-like site-specific DNA recombinase